MTEPITEQTPAQKEEAYYRRQFEKSQRELEQLRAERETARSEAEQTRLELLKRDLCAREGLPTTLARYVAGTDEESLVASIRQVREDFPAAPPERGIGLPTRPGKQILGDDPEALSPMQKIAAGLGSH